MPFSLMKPWHKFLLVAAVFGFLGYVTISVAPRRDRITQREGSSPVSLAQEVREKDRDFLDDLVQKQSYDDRHSRNPFSAPDQNIGKAGTIKLFSGSRLSSPVSQPASRRSVDPGV